MPYTKDFTKETLLGRLESVEAYLRQFRDPTIVKKKSGIRSHGGTTDDDEFIWKILKTLTPPFKSLA